MKEDCAMTGRLVISLDFELMWGVRDHRSASEYGDAIMGGRRAIPEMLAHFSRRNVRATWATVGFLFARNREEIMDFAPTLLPNYGSIDASPYAFVQSGLGGNEDQDPLHFGHSLVNSIAETEGQEIATHSFSHFCCLEPGHSKEAFASDLSAARSIAKASGIQIRSLVFARNQMNSDFVSVAQEEGIKVFRGNPTSFAYRPRASRENNRLVRAVRLADSIAPISPRLDFENVSNVAEIHDLPASRFLRPYNRKIPWISLLQTRRVKQEITRAARDHRIYHLWWHPHNFGRDTGENIRQLCEILDHFVAMRDEFGMQSSTMADFA